MTEAEIQRVVARVLNTEYPEPWGAWPATAADGTEYVELRNETSGERFIVTVQRGH